MNEEDIKIDLINRIGEERYEHCVRVSQTAIEIAKKIGFNVEKAKIAGYFHDCGKILDEKELIKACDKYGLNLTDDMKKTSKIIHGFLGALIANQKYGIKDEEILNAIKWHTTGKPNMSILEKIIFLADYTEPKRNFNGVDKIRELIDIDLDKALYNALNDNLIFLCKKNSYIGLDTIKSRNYYIQGDAND